MSSRAVSWDDAQQGSTIQNLEYQVEIMRSAKNKILPEIDVLRPGWDTEGSKQTIDSLENFLNNDFEEFIKAFNITVNKLNKVRELSTGMNQIR